MKTMNFNPLFKVSNCPMTSMKLSFLLSSSHVMSFILHTDRALPCMHTLSARSARLLQHRSVLACSRGPSYTMYWIQWKQWIQYIILDKVWYCPMKTMNSIHFFRQGVIASRCLLMPPSASRGLPDVFRWLQMPPRCLLMLPDASWCLQVPPEASQVPP